MSRIEQTSHTPLAERMRPRTLEEFYGQDHLVGEGKLLTRLAGSDQPISLIFWGPPGSGKTTLASILTHRFDFPSFFFSAVLASVKDIKQVMADAEKHKRLFGRPSILFLDEIHRFNKAQQAAFLPYVERGDIILFGSTTENPSFEVIGPLLSRTRVLELQPLKEESLARILREALEDKQRGLGETGLGIEEDALNAITAAADGDARRALTTLEIASRMPAGGRITLDSVREALQHRHHYYDKSGEEHFNLISALHKSLRNSDVDASLYWLARMTASGEDRLYIARRLVRFAAEDIGLADPQALTLALSAKAAYEFLGTPEGELALAELVVYMASAPKSNRVYAAWGRVMRDVEARPNEPVPKQLRNPVTRMMRDFGYGADYQYAHDAAESTTDMETMPEGLKGRRYYDPGDMGFEKDIRRRIQWWTELKRRLRSEEPPEDEPGSSQNT
jgi:putative ATPase